YNRWPSKGNDRIFSIGKGQCRKLCIYKSIKPWCFHKFETVIQRKLRSGIFVVATLKSLFETKHHRMSFQFYVINNFKINTRQGLQGIRRVFGENAIANTAKKSKSKL